MKKYGYWIFLFVLSLLAICVLSDLLLSKELIPQSEYVALLFCAAIYVNSPLIRKHMPEMLKYFLNTLLVGFGALYVLMLVKIDISSMDTMKTIVLVALVVILVGCIIYEKMLKHRAAIADQEKNTREDTDAADEPERRE